MKKHQGTRRFPVQEGLSHDRRRGLAPMFALAVAVLSLAAARQAWGAPGDNPADPANPANPTNIAPQGGGAVAGGDYDFLLANLMATDGQLPEALSAFDRAEKASPEAAYIYLEHAQLLARMAQAIRQPSAQAGNLRKAAAAVDKARQIAPHNLDVERGVGLVYLELSTIDQAALPTALAALEEVHQS